MRIPAIEELKLLIADKRTRSSMDAVLSCFYSDNLRGAVVMLYVTVISDLYYKLCDLDVIYHDPGAKLIKDEIDKEWETKDKLSKWENTILEKCYECKKILTSISYSHALALQKERHLCAHPTIDNTRNLYHPNSAKVQGMIMDMLQGILCRPAFLGKKFFDAFINDIDTHSDSFANKEELAKYIEQKYLNKINNKNEEYELFKTLWKFVFQLQDELANKNRSANYTVLLRLYERNEADFDQLMKTDTDYYANKINLNDPDLFKLIIICFNEYRAVCKAMSESFHTELENTLNAPTNKHLKAIAFCASTDEPAAHCMNHAHDIANEDLRYIQDFLIRNISESSAIDVSIRVYKESWDFSRAHVCFADLIAPILTKMSVSQLEELIKVCNSNGQIYSSWVFLDNKYRIVEEMRKKNPNFDYSPYQDLRLELATR